MTAQSKSATPAMPSRIDLECVVGGVSHDLDYVRRQLMNQLAEWPEIRCGMHADFRGPAFAGAATGLISYTCDVRPDAATQASLAQFVHDGGRWLALHGTNSYLEWTDAGVASAHDDGPFFQTLGTAFIAHPPMGEFEVYPVVTDHPLTQGIEPFTVHDELYLTEQLADIDVLLATDFSGDAPGFTRDRWTADTPAQARRPIMYLHRVGSGQVLYLNLGHARGHWDAPHRTPYYPTVERGAWEAGSFRELLRRSLRWVAGDPRYA